MAIDEVPDSSKHPEESPIPSPVEMNKSNLTDAVRIGFLSALRTRTGKETKS
jgi:hypothetical protein